MAGVLAWYVGYDGARDGPVRACFFFSFVFALVSVLFVRARTRFRCLPL